MWPREARGEIFAEILSEIKFILQSLFISYEVCFLLHSVFCFPLFDLLFVSGELQSSKDSAIFKVSISKCILLFSVSFAFYTRKIINQNAII